MRYFIFSIVFLLFISSLSFSEEIDFSQLQGQWINKSYLELFHRTRSHHKAMQSNEYPAFYISQEDSIYEWAVSIRFHEGMRYNLCGLNPCSEPDTYELVFHDYQDHGRISELDRFFFPDGITGNEIVWIFTPTSGSSYFSESSKIEQYKISFVRFKPPLEDYINYVLLVGTYSDKNGRTFTFHHPGKAKWPDKSFSYKISLDAY